MTEQQQREKALLRAMARARVDMDLPYDRDVAQVLDVGKSSFCDYKKDPYRSFGFQKASHFCRKLRLTGKEVCEIIGVPYIAEKEARE